MTACVVLAAGASARLGRAKALLPHRGTTLVRRACAAALGAGLRPVIVVVGSAAERIRDEVAPLGVEIVVNPEWEEGLSSSIRAGVAALRNAGEPIEAVVLAVCDQPRLDAAVLRRLVERHRRDRSPMVACAYGGTVGVPALFDRGMFDDLLRLRGPHGARGLLRGGGGRVARIEWPDGAIDVDTPEDAGALE